jgi:hypothetical protein
MKVLMRRYSHLKVPQEREGRGWQVPRDVLTWHILIAEEGRIWEAGKVDTAFILRFVANDDASRPRIYWLAKDLHHSMGTYPAVPTNYGST